MISLLAFLNFALVGVFLSIRDTILVSELRDPDTNQADFICSDFPRCYRLIPILLSISIEKIMQFFTRNLSINPDPFLSDPVTLEARMKFVEFFVSASFRLAVLTILWFVIKRIQASTLKAHIYFCALLIVLMAPISKLLFVLMDFAPVSVTQKQWAYSMPVIFLIDYDYFALLIIFLSLRYIKNIEKIGWAAKLFVGTFLFLSFEFLPIYIFLLMLFYKRHIEASNFLFLLPGIVIVTLSQFLVVSTASKSTIATFSFYARENFTNLLGLFSIIVLTLTTPIVLGLFINWLLNVRFNQKRSIENTESIRLLMSAFSSLCLVHLLSLATSGVTSEFARQSLGLQAIILLLTANLRISRTRK